MSEQPMEDLRKGAVDGHTDELRAFAKELFQRLKPYKLKRSLEVEVRLCRFTQEEDIHPPIFKREDVQPGGRLRLVKAVVEPGVSAEHYERIKALCVCMTKGEAVSLSRTRDISTRSWRYTYTADDPTCCIACIRKKRLFVCDILVPFGVYNLRFSASTEMPGTVPAAGDAPKSGHVRQKVRQSVTDGLFRYDMTTVTEGGVVTHEVEVEGVFTDRATQLTESWLEELLARALTLATLHSKSSSGSSGVSGVVSSNCS